MSEFSVWLALSTSQVVFAFLILMLQSGDAANRKLGSGDASLLFGSLFWRDGQVHETLGTHTSITLHRNYT